MIWFHSTIAVMVSAWVLPNPLSKTPTWLASQIEIKTLSYHQVLLNWFWINLANKNVHGNWVNSLESFPRETERFSTLTLAYLVEVFSSSFHRQWKISIYFCEKSATMSISLRGRSAKHLSLLSSESSPARGMYLSCVWWILSPLRIESESEKKSTKDI